MDMVYGDERGLVTVKDNEQGLLGIEDDVREVQDQGGQLDSRYGGKYNGNGGKQAKDARRCV